MSPRMVTFGCRLNSFESEVMRSHAAAAGLQNAVIVHTCAVTAEAERQARQAIRRARREHPTARHLVDGLDGRSRAIVQVQNGCDHRCTFFIIPYGRGPSRSVPIGAIVAQTRRLVESGYREVVLTGVDLTSYGKDLPGEPTLGGMVKRLLRLVPELARLRLSSIDPAEVDRDLLDLV